MMLVEESGLTLDRPRGALQEESYGRNIGHSTTTQAGKLIGKLNFTSLYN